MGDLAKQIAIYIGLLLVFSTFTIITPFYPKIAQNKGIPFWMIGFIFSLNPIANLLISPILGKYMNSIGRKNTVIASFLFTSASMVFLSPIEMCEKNAVIILSFFSRICGGLGGGCILNSVTTIFTSDYPDKIQTMIGRMEAAIGLGLILGPVIGTVLYEINMFSAFLCMGIAVLVFSPAAWKMLGTFRTYQILDTKLNKRRLIMRPKIFLSMLMNTAFLFSFGLVDTILEIHLDDFGVNRLFISMCFVLQSSVYLFISLTAGSLLKSLDERIVMVFGVMCLSGSYLMLGPFRLFPDEVGIVVAALPLMGIGESLTYSKKYLVFSIPFMIRSAVNDYGYVDDDLLADTISSMAVIAGAIGEILGPLYAGFFSGEFGIEACCTSAAAATFIFGVVYALGSGCSCKSNVKINSSIQEELFKE